MRVLIQLRELFYLIIDPVMIHHALPSGLTHDSSPFLVHRIETILCDNTRMSPAGNRSPVSLSNTTSLTPGISDAITGTPIAIASRRTYGIPSQSEGKIRTSNRAHISAISLRCPVRMTFSAIFKSDTSPRAFLSSIPCPTSTNTVRGKCSSVRGLRVHERLRGAAPEEGLQAGRDRVPHAQGRHDDQGEQALDVDVLVVGAGPAGSTTARFCAGDGVDVLVIDRRKEIGYPVQCGEMLPHVEEMYTIFPKSEQLEELFTVPPQLVDGESDHVDLVSPGGGRTGVASSRTSWTGGPSTSTSRSSRSTQARGSRQAHRSWGSRTASPRRPWAPSGPR